MGASTDICVGADQKTTMAGKWMFQKVWKTIIPGSGSLTAIPKVLVEADLILVNKVNPNIDIAAKTNAWGLRHLHYSVFVSRRHHSLQKFTTVRADKAACSAHVRHSKQNWTASGILLNIRVLYNMITGVCVFRKTPQKSRYAAPSLTGANLKRGRCVLSFRELQCS